MSKQDYDMTLNLPFPRIHATLAALRNAGKLARRDEDREVYEELASQIEHHLADRTLAQEAWEQHRGDIAWLTQAEKRALPGFERFQLLTLLVEAEKGKGDEPV